jgi:release factor glutamine methyltransferase
MDFNNLHAHFKQKLNTDLYAESEADFLFDVFVEDQFGLSKTQWKLNKTQKISPEDWQSFETKIQPLNSGQPYQQIIGKAPFYQLDFKVNAHVLIPRPETEELVDMAKQQITQHYGAQPIKILDIGTGTGCLAICLAKAFPKAQVTAIDVCPEALAVAKENAQNHHIANIQWLEMDVLKYHPAENFDVIISNPPYIGQEEHVEMTNRVLDFEPHKALFSPENQVLSFYESIALLSENQLNHGGLLFLEINQKYPQETLALYQNMFASSAVLQDLSGNYRFITGQK